MIKMSLRRMALARVLPVGQISKNLSSPFCKNISVFIGPKSHAYSRLSRALQGAFRDRHGRWARDAMDAIAATDARG
jgi:hypothetical protein